MRTLVVLSVLVVTMPAAAQTAPAAVFQKWSAEERIPELLARSCAAPIEVVTDFATFESKAWDESSDADEAVRAASLMCIEALRGVANACTSNARLALKTVRCTFSAPARSAGVDEDLYVRQNLSYAQGVLTFRAHRTMSNVADNTSAVIVKGMGSGVAGEACKTFADCESSLCAKGVCVACGGSVACRAGTRCHMTVCRTEAEISDMASTLSSPQGTSSSSKPATSLKGLGQMCKANSDCKSGKCEQRTARLRTCQ